MNLIRPMEMNTHPATLFAQPYSGFLESFCVHTRSITANGQADVGD